VRFVLDASAMVALLRDEPGARVVEDCLAIEPPACIAHAVNLCEVFYTFLEDSGEDAARGAINDLRGAGLIVREDMDEAFWQEVGRFKVRFRIPLADSFVLSLADRFGAEIVTSDRGDFEPIAKSGLCRVTFIR
jgi:PIN domain nuclease of toxin-antitoxin system